MSVRITDYSVWRVNRGLIKPIEPGWGKPLVGKLVYEIVTVVSN